MNNQQYTFIDLFCGCGGFSLGLRQAGLTELAAIDFDQDAIKVFSSNFENEISPIKEDLTEFTPKQLASIIGQDHVNIVVGGPPCQGFSTVRQRDGSNSGIRIIDDHRRNLYKEFLKFVGFFKPEIFVMENVLGIKSAGGGHYFNRVQVEARKLGYRVYGQKINSWEFGVPQKRVRQLIIGTKLNLPLFYSTKYLSATHGEEYSVNNQNIVTLWEAIGDLPQIPAGGGDESMQYDFDLRETQLIKYTGRFLIDVLEINKSKNLTAHRARPHNERDLRDFSRIQEGETGSQACIRGEEIETPYNSKIFKDRYTKQHRNRLCSTIVAHLSKDGLMFIHPTQNRSITPREAARIQSFPDTFQFPVPRTTQFRLIGNAVPPLVAKNIGMGIIKWFDDFEINILPGKNILSTEKEAVINLKIIAPYINSKNIAKIPTDLLINGWISLAYIFYHLHPDSAFENGDLISNEKTQYFATNSELLPDWFTPIYERSGWPILLTPVAKEVRSRYENGSISQEDYYCSYYFVLGYQNSLGRKK
jgi:DNA (cytosine-5)-methyltransferase 1